MRTVGHAKPILPARKRIQAIWPIFARAQQRFYTCTTVLIYAGIRPTAVIMTARIYQRPKNAMQSGRAGTDEWLLEFAPAEAKRSDPLMGWAGSGDTQSQVVLRFASRAEAQAYADQVGLTASVHPTPPRRLKLQAYADNFR